MDFNSKDYICGIMQISLDEAKQRYGILHIWHNYTNLDSAELFSGTMYDPEVIAHLDAEHLAGGKPYEVLISLFGIELQEGESIYEMNRKELWQKQRICTQMFVFNDELGKLKFIEEQTIK